MKEEKLSLKVNGVNRELSIPVWTTLLDALRNELNLTGTKKGCDHGQCGACTILINGHSVNSCLCLAVMHTADEITTIEGISSSEQTLHPVQKEFLEQDAFQCGYCTPGQICSAFGIIKRRLGRSDEEIKDLMSGNLCRCGAYNNIFKAVKKVVKNETNPI